ncbi:hypothetical protein [Nocardia farcinica]|uniref:hypothetical protein n=1 Tax=Nocardia farcinica TaxID=37329 RepID=UPI0024574601|nr:hypothetical protein [Nocardia farcinica]
MIRVPWRLLSRIASMSCSITLIAVSVSALSAADPDVSERIEWVYPSTSSVPSVISSVVRRHLPLPASAGPRPPECDQLSYLRFRSAAGPEEAARADRILVAQPGIFEGASAFESLARNTVAAAAQQGAHLEFWALDRRSNCLEDHTGRLAGLRTGSLDVATAYYFGGAEIDGRRFAGFPVDGPAVAWLANQGLAQTLRDQYDLLRAELPDAAVRARKVLCGGHSLGGLITGNFAEWDFDGDPATTDDAGHRQCAGYFALDTAVSADPAALTAQAELPDLPPAVSAVLAAGTGRVGTALPVLAAPAVINPETMNLLALAGLAAHLEPEGVDQIVARLPRNPNVDATLRVLLAQDHRAVLTGHPDIRTLHATNTAVLGAILDDNSQPFAFLQASTGFLAPGTPVGPKSFPLPTAAAAALPLGPALFGTAKKFAPTGFDPGTVYRWSDYDAVDPARFDATTPDSEITSVHELARDLCEPPLDFTEWYFPTRLTLDTATPGGPGIDRHRRYPDAATGAPTITFVAADGVGVRPPPETPGRVVDLPGYNHLDVVTAAAEQNDGRPETVSTQLAAFAVAPS